MGGRVKNESEGLLSSLELDLEMESPKKDGEGLTFITYSTIRLYAGLVTPPWVQTPDPWIS